MNEEQENRPPRPAEAPPSAGGADSEEGRRDFLMKAGSVCAGCALAGVPAVPAALMVAHPAVSARRGGGSEAPFLPVASLEALPADGTPVKLTVRADKVDAWSRFPDQVVGAVFVRRVEGEDGDPRLQAFNVVCPHLGCAIDFRARQRDYYCPCHNSVFDLEDGAQGEGSPSARGMDELETRVSEEGEVLVQFRNFVMGIADKRPV